MIHNPEQGGYPLKLASSMKKLLVAAGFVVYLYALVKLIVFKGGTVDAHFLLQQLERTLQHPHDIFQQHGNYTPFKEISRDMQSMSISSPFSSANLIGNILAFIPLGIFIPKLYTSRAVSFLKVFLLALALSLCFEVTQLLLYIGTFDVDDLILNSFGGLVGYTAFRIWKRSAKILYGL